MPTTRPFLLLALLLATSCSTVAGRPAASKEPAADLPAAVTPVGLFADARLGIEVAQGELRLPARIQRPRLTLAPGETGAGQLYLSRTALPKPGAAGGGDEFVTWRVHALRRNGAKEVRLELTVEPGAPVQTVGWAIAAGAVASRETLQEWATRRFFAQDAMREGDGPLQGPLVRAAVRAYGFPEKGYWGSWDERRSGDGSDDQASLLALLGGRAAVDETLQLERGLDGRGAAGSPAEASVPIAGVEGVKAEPHPWAEMLAGRTAPRLPLAEVVPPDRVLIYLPQPKEALDGFENGAAGFLQRVSSFAREGRLDYSVITRYLDELGLGDGLGRKLLRLGVVKEAVLFASDLSFLSGTDLTVVAEVSALFQPLLPLPDGELHEKATPAGVAFRARRGSRVFLSNSRVDIERALALHDAGGAGSLGRSDELAVMLLRLAPTARTQAFAYLSDPFIRRLVGPAQRIGTLRQGRARALMEELAGAAFLRRQDLPAEPPTIEGLKRLGYLAPEFPEEGLTLAPDGRVASATYGPLERLRPVSRLGLVAVTPAEAKAYQEFRQQYSEYWRRYFDPIAVRYDVRPDGSRELETFILPLLDSSIYRELARDLAPAAPASTRVPRWSFPATVALSLQLSPEAAERAKSAREHLPHEFANALGAAEEDFLAALGSSVHLAFADAAPILQVGGGSAFGLVAARAGRSDQLWIPLALAALTRPVVLAIELKDPEKAQRALERLTAPVALAGGRGRFREVEWRLAREEDGRLILTIDVLGVVTLRPSVRVEDRWLVVANDATLPARLVAGSQELPGAVARAWLRPAALRLGLPAAWQTAVEADAHAGWAAQHWLAPWLTAGLGVDDAVRASVATFGTAPVLHAGDLVPGPFNVPEHRRYGTPYRPRIPARDPKADFGLLEGISEARVEASFEEDGLRTRVVWTTAAPGGK
jgi:hypothetical protein